MSNHISSKFIGLVFSPMSQAAFESVHETLIEELRGKFPRFDVQKIQDIKLDVSSDSLGTERTNALVVNMVDAEGKVGATIGNSGVFVSVDGYLSYFELLEELKFVLDSIEKILKISHFVQVQLRNLNLFSEIEEEPGQFQDIKEQNNWGTHTFNAIKSKSFVCSGAATRHEYLSEDRKRHLMIASSVVVPGNSYIPQSEWLLWRLRGPIPAAENVKLLIDLVATSFQAAVDTDEKNKVTKYSWETVKLQLDILHNDVNSVYEDIIKE